MHMLPHIQVWEDHPIKLPAINYKNVKQYIFTIYIYIYNDDLD